MKPQLVKLQDARDLNQCGAKAFNLGFLLRKGFPSAPGFVIPDHVFQAHIRRCGDAALPSCREAEEGALPLAPELEQALVKQFAHYWPKKLAVRSSALGEDASNASFAGQLETQLSINSHAQLCLAIRQVWASLEAESVLQYAKHKGLVVRHMGVIVQEQVDAQWSGVLFTCAPDNAQDLLIEFCEGLGEQLVSGAITPGRLRIERSTGRITTEQGKLAEEQKSNIQKLASLALQLEKKLGAPQDIEWSIDQNNQLFLLQSRPITTQAPTLEHWSNANIAENFPDPVTPFLYSVVSRGYSAYFRNLGFGFGLSKSGMKALEPAFDQVVGLHAGRLYYNLSNIHALCYLAPGGHWLARFFNQFTGAQSFPQTHQFKPQTLIRWALAVKVAFKIVWQYVWIESGIQQFERQALAFAKRAHPHALITKTAPQLADDLRDFLTIRLKRWNNAALADTAAMVCYGLLKHQSNQHNDLLKGLPGLISGIPVIKLWDLSRHIRTTPDLHALFLQTDAAGVWQQRNNPHFNNFFERFNDYLEQWGFRSSGELMLTAPTPFEDPLPTLRVLQMYVKEPARGPEQVSAQQAALRKAATEKITQQLTLNRWWRAMPLSRAGRFRLLLRATQSAIALRERARFKQALLYTRLRQIALQLGERFVQNQLIEEREDVFFLTTDEVLELAQTPWLHAQKLIAERKFAFQNLPQNSPPDSFVLPRGAQWQAPLSPTHTSANTSDQLFGTSACGGTAQGKAVVVLDVSQAHQIKAGDLLVTRQTDPGWASIFFLIKGLVIERGGMLSHGAIIAREYGIPAVVGVPNATQIIKTGDTLLIDGNVGRISKA